MHLADEWPLVFLFRLPPDAVIVVAGAYRGRVCDLLATLYPDYGRIIGFEPQAAAVAAARRRLARHRDITIEPYAIGDHAGTMVMADTNSRYASLTPAAGRASAHGTDATVEMRGFGAAMSRLGVARIDLLVLNIEGYEFALVPHLLDRGWIGNGGAIERLAVQVHWGSTDDARWPHIERRIERTHKRVFDESPSWLYWQWSGG